MDSVGYNSGSEKKNAVTKETKFSLLKFSLLSSVSKGLYKLEFMCCRCHDSSLFSKRVIS